MCSSYTGAVREKIFVNSMGDLFHEEVPPDFIARVGDIMGRADWHLFQIVTRRDGQMRELLSGELRRMADLQNVAYGVSVEDRRYRLPRVRSLQGTRQASGSYRCAERVLPRRGPGDAGVTRQRFQPLFFPDGIAFDGKRLYSNRRNRTNLQLLAAD
jgi:hypothetical protein